MARVRFPVFSSPGPGSIGLRLRFFEPLLFLVLAVAATWPLATHLVGHLPLGSEEAATVPLFNLWTIWWNADRAAAGFADYWQAPIFYPAKDALAFSEPLSPTLIVAPLFWLGWPPELVYNLLLLAILAGNGWAACALLRRLHLHPLVPILGGALLVLSPLLLSWLGVLQLVALFPAILAMLTLDRLRRRPTIGRGLLFGGALALTALCCSYYGLFLLLPLAVATPLLFGRRLWRLRTLEALGAGLALCCVLLVPQLLVQRQAIGSTLTYDLRTLAALSAVAADYLVAPRPGLLGIEALAPAGHEPIFRLGFGLIIAILALVGASHGLADRRRRDWSCFWLAMAGCAFVLSLGPLLAVAGVRPYLLLVEHLPGFAQARNVMRFAAFVHVPVLFLAALGLQALAILLRRYGRCLAPWPVLLVAILAAVEIPPGRQPLFALPQGGREPDWVAWLKEHSDPHRPIVCLPFACKSDVVSYQQQTLWMYYQTMHRRPLLNGYSAAFPEEFKRLKWRMAEFPAPHVLDLLQMRGVRHCVVRRGAEVGRPPFAPLFLGDRWQRAFYEEESGVEIYRFLAGP